MAGPTSIELEAARDALIRKIQASLKPLVFGAMATKADRIAAKKSQYDSIASQLAVSPDGAVSYEGVKYNLMPTLGGGFNYAEGDFAAEDPVLGAGAGLPDGFYMKKSGKVYRYGSDTEATAEEIQAGYARDVQRSAAAQAANRPPPHKVPGVDATTGMAYTFDPGTGEFSTKGFQVQWPEEDPKLKTQREREEFESKLELERQKAEQDGLLTREQIDATRENSERQIAAQRENALLGAREQRFSTLANLAPELGRMATDASKRAQDIFAHGSDVGFRLFAQRGKAGESPVGQVTPADQINALMGQMGQISDYLTRLQAQYGEPGAGTAAPTAAGAPTARTGLPTARPAAGTPASAAKPQRVFNGGFTGDVASDQQRADAMKAAGIPPEMVDAMWKEALIGASDPKTAPLVQAAAGIPVPGQSAIVPSTITPGDYTPPDLYANSPIEPRGITISDPVATGTNGDKRTMFGSPTLGGGGIRLGTGAGAPIPFSAFFNKVGSIDWANVLRTLGKQMPYGGGVIE